MSPMLTDVAPKWVTATVDAIRGVFRRPALSNRALWVLDLANQANAKVYEDEFYRSWAVDHRGVMHDVTRPVDQLLAHGYGCLAAGHWISDDGRTVYRRWDVTAFGALTLVAAGRARPLAIEAGAGS